MSVSGFLVVSYAPVVVGRLPEFVCSTT